MSTDTQGVKESSTSGAAADSSDNGLSLSNLKPSTISNGDVFNNLAVDITRKDTQSPDCSGLSTVLSSTPSKGELDVEDDSSNDSTTLQIVVPESVKKRKHSLAFDIDKEIENDIELALETKQRKTNLTVKNVKSILRYVIENEAVLAMINSSMKFGEELDVEPKITRSKARQLREENQIQWPLSPIPVAPPDIVDKEHLVLIQGELPEEEDDDEYRPTLDDLDNSDDESGRQSIGTPSLDASTAGRYLESFDARFLDDSVHNVSTPQSEPDDVTFKKPPGIVKPESIGQRTRSKYSLSSTPLETIEQAFVPPDITTDMYDFKCVDQEWENFLKEFMQPLPNDPADPDEDDDPEYNAMAEVEQIDKEELRRDRAVKVSRAEVRKLMEELAGGAEEPSSEEEEEQPSVILPALPPPSDPKPVVVVEVDDSRLDAAPEEEEGIGVTANQQRLLLQQIRQHVQLCTQSFLLSHCHPCFSDNAARYKVLLAQLVALAENNSKSVLNVFNLNKSFVLVEEWERLLMSSQGIPIINHMIENNKLEREAKKHKQLHKSTIHPVLMAIISQSNLFMYPRLLPHQPLRGISLQSRKNFVNAEDHLIALGLEQMLPLFKDTQPENKQHGIRGDLLATCDEIHNLIMPGRTSIQIRGRVRTMKTANRNPIWHFFKYGCAPKTSHEVIPFATSSVVAPKDQSYESLPPNWAEFVRHVKSCKQERCTRCGKAVPVKPSVLHPNIKKESSKT